MQYIPLNNEDTLLRNNCVELLLRNDVKGFKDFVASNSSRNEPASQRLNFVKNFIIHAQIDKVFFSLDQRSNSPEISFEMLEAIVTLLYSTKNLYSDLDSFLHKALMRIIHYKNDTKPLVYVLEKIIEVKPSRFKKMNIDLFSILLKNSSTECIKVIIDFFVEKYPKAFGKLDYSDIHEYTFVPVGNFLELCFQICINMKLTSKLNAILQLLTPTQIEAMTNSQHVKISVADKFESLLLEIENEKVSKWFKDVCEKNMKVDDSFKNYALYYRYAVL